MAKKQRKVAKRIIQGFSRGDHAQNALRVVERATGGKLAKVEDAERGGRKG